MSIYASSSLKKNLNSSHSKGKKRKSRNCSTVYMWGYYNNRMVSVFLCYQPKIQELADTWWRLQGKSRVSTHTCKLACLFLLSLQDKWACHDASWCQKTLPLSGCVQEAEDAKEETEEWKDSDGGHFRGPTQMVLLTSSYTFYRANERSRSRHSYSLTTCICTFICTSIWLCRFKSPEQQR